jgi:hypothetical protein
VKSERNSWIGKEGIKIFYGGKEKQIEDKIPVPRPREIK